MPPTAYDRITERVLELLNKGVCPWRQPWSTHHTPPHNYATKRPYSGINALVLSCTGYATNQFLTFRQVSALGGRVKAGEHGFPAVYWGRIEPGDKSPTNAEKSSEASRERPTMFLKSYSVFNAAQIEGIKFEDSPEVPHRTEPPLVAAKEIADGWLSGPKVIHGHNRACYVLELDRIYLPDLKKFTSQEAYYAIRFHEMAHATGAPHRLDRPLDNRFGDAAYAREELIAEMTAAFLCAKAGIDNHTIENQAAYLDNWRRAIGTDPRLIVQASGAAQRAANFIEANELTPPVLNRGTHEMAKLIENVMPAMQSRIKPDREIER